MAACSANPVPSNAGPGNSHTTTPTSTVSATASPSRPADSPSTTPSGPGGVQDLAVSSAVSSELTATFVAYIGIQVSDLPGDGPIAADTYYAYDPATDIYWAYATFPVDGAAPASVIAAFQKYGSSGLFRKAGAGPWQVTTTSAEGTFCPVLQFFPPAVLTAWALPTTPPAGQSC
jgi:hypothetical protein